MIARLKDAASDGLNPSDYPVPDFAAATTPDALAEADLKLTASMLDYARQAQSGRMHWSQVSADIQYPEHPTDPAEVLANVIDRKGRLRRARQLQPAAEALQELKKKLAELRGQGDGPVIPIADGPALKYIARQGQEAAGSRGGRSARAAASRQARHHRKRRRHPLRRQGRRSRAQLPGRTPTFKATGVLDNRTVNALNSPKRDKQIDTVLVNMERWRWLPRDLGVPSLGDAYVILNIPDYTLKVMQHGAQVWTTRVVTGKPGTHATPLLTETMKYITVNPTWNVPPSIVYNEYLPALQQDPTVLQRMGLRLEQNRDGSVHISQPPGEANALGRIRFNFPNKFLVYQHDTPDKYLFEKTERAYSHGCMRVQYPDQYAAVLLNIALPNEKWTPERIRSMYGSSEIDLKFPTPIPVNITYQTAFVDDAGKLQIRKDVYGRDATMISMLKGAAHAGPGERGRAFAAGLRQRPAARPAAGRELRQQWRRLLVRRPSFFERLFGGPPTPPAPVGRRGQPQPASAGLSPGNLSPADFGISR